MELGIYSFAETPLDPDTGRQVGAPERVLHLLEEMELADQVGLDVFGVGEHHRPDYAVSSPAVVLAAAAARTRRIRLTSAVSVLSSDDPVRVFQDFALLDLISEGRAEIMAGRGSFTESFPLFGQDLADYDEIFRDKLQLLLKLREEESVDWPGTRHRPAIHRRGVYPRPVQDPIPIWLAVGGTPNSVARAAHLGLPMALAIIGGIPVRFAPLVDGYRTLAAQAGHDPASLPVGINVHGFVAEDGDEARELAFPAFASTMDRIGRERGWPPTTRARFEAECGPDGPHFVGSPDEVTEKILRLHRVFRHDRMLIQLTVGPLPHGKVLRAIELLGQEVAPAVREGTTEARAG
ncbi:MAG: LLM class flavin-dependent oxidoreductase [Gemmatimonadales bacterium]|nr:MAG: LLM class flavin-dependent oxidoreductase [Gemmatimonadales bacterium]